MISGIQYNKDTIIDIPGWPKTAEEAIQYNIQKWIPDRCGRGRNGKEHEFRNFIIEHIHDIALVLKFSPITGIAKEYLLAFGRIDIFTAHQDDSYTIWEVKIDNPRECDGIDFASGIGQLLAYQTIFQAQYHIDASRIHLVLAINKTSRWACNIIQNWGLPIDIAEIGRDDLKITKYAKTNG